MSVCVCVWTKGRKNTFASPSRHYHIKDSFTVLFFSLSFSPSPVLLELELTWIRKSPCNVFINSQTLWHPTTSSLLPNTELFLHSSRWAPCGIRITKIIWTENWVHEQKKKTLEHQKIWCQTTTEYFVRAHLLCGTDSISNWPRTYFLIFEVTNETLQRSHLPFCLQVIWKIEWKRYELLCPLNSTEA